MFLSKCKFRGETPLDCWSSFFLLPSVVICMASRPSCVLSMDTTQGNPITCLGVSGDKRWLVTGDQGHRPLLTVWDSYSGVPVRTFFDGLGSGCVAVALSHDALHLGLLSSQSPQVMSMWRWTEQSEQPMCSIQLTDHTHQSHLTFHPSDHSQLISTGEFQVAFFLWDGQKLHNSSKQVTEKVRLYMCPMSLYVLFCNHPKIVTM
jgi:hypothetical protein